MGFGDVLYGVGTEATNVTAGQDKAQEQRNKDRAYSLDQLRVMKELGLSRQEFEERKRAASVSERQTQQQIDLTGKQIKQLDPEERVALAQKILKERGMPWNGNVPLTAQQAQALQLAGLIPANVKEPIEEQFSFWQERAKAYYTANPKALPKGKTTEQAAWDYANEKTSQVGGGLNPRVSYSTSTTFRNGVGAGGKAIDVTGMTPNQKREFDAKTTSMRLNQSRLLQRINSIQNGIDTMSIINTDAAYQQISMLQAQADQLGTQIEGVQQQIMNERPMVVNHKPSGIVPQTSTSTSTTQRTTVSGPRSAEDYLKQQQP